MSRYQGSVRDALGITYNAPATKAVDGRYGWIQRGQEYIRQHRSTDFTADDKPMSLDAQTTPTSDPTPEEGNQLFHGVNRFSVPQPSSCPAVLSIVLPTDNEQEGTSTVIRRVRNLFEEFELTFDIIGSDSSTGRTPGIARGLDIASSAVRGNVPSLIMGNAQGAAR